MRFSISGVLLVTMATAKVAHLKKRKKKRLQYHFWPHRGRRRADGAVEAETGGEQCSITLQQFCLNDLHPVPLLQASLCKQLVRLKMLILNWQQRENYLHVYPTYLFWVKTVLTYEAFMIIYCHFYFPGRKSMATCLESESDWVPTANHL